MRSVKLIILIFSLPYYCFSQGGIDHIKNQSYMKYSDKSDCNDPGPDNLTSRICANLQYQRSDSLLVIVYKNFFQNKQQIRQGSILLICKKIGECLEINIAH